MLPFKLAEIKVMVKTLRVKQLCMRTALDNLSLIDDQNLIGFPDGAQPVGNDKAGPSFHQPQHGFLDVLLRTGIHTARRFIEDQNTRDLPELPARLPEAGAVPGSDYCPALKVRSGNLGVNDG